MLPRLRTRTIKGWPKVIGLGLSKLPLKAAALVVVPFLDDEDRVNHPIWGVRDATDLSWYNIAFRNGVHNVYTRDMPFWRTTASNTADETLEAEKGLQWRVRRSYSGEYVSFRVTWGKPRPSKGKREIYIGWTMNEKDYMRLTFIQFRLF